MKLQMCHSKMIYVTILFAPYAVLAEQNDTPAGATDLTPFENEWFTSQVTEGDDDWYKIEVTGPGELDWDVNSLGGGAVVSLVAYLDPDSTSPPFLSVTIVPTDSDGFEDLVVPAGNATFFAVVGESSGFPAGNGFYKIKVAFTQTLAPPTPPCCPSPTDGAVLDLQPAVLDWSNVPSAESYDLYLDGSMVANVTDSFWNVGISIPLGGHTWQVVSRNSAGTAAGPIWSFSIAPQLTLVLSGEVDRQCPPRTDPWIGEVSPGDEYALILTATANGNPVSGASIPVTDDFHGIQSVLTTDEFGEAVYDGAIPPGDCGYRSSTITFGPATKPQFDSSSAIVEEVVFGPPDLKDFPVLLVHGLWSDHSTWTDSGNGGVSLYEELCNSGYRLGGNITASGSTATGGYCDADVYTLDFSSDEDLRFWEQAIELEAVNGQLHALRSGATCAPQRTILVGHSMGGLASRWFLQFHSNAAQEVAELITIGTPHLGSPVADIANEDVVIPMMWRPSLEAWLGNIESVALDELQPNSEAISTLANVVANPMPNSVRYFFISAGSITLAPDVGIAYWNFVDSISPFLPENWQSNFVAFGNWMTEVGEVPSDGIVPEYSQALVNAATNEAAYPGITIAEPVFHTGETREPSIVAEVVAAANAMEQLGCGHVESCPGGNLSASSSVLDFGRVLIGTCSAPESLDLVNISSCASIGGSASTTDETVEIVAGGDYLISPLALHEVDIQVCPSVAGVRTVAIDFTGGVDVTRVLVTFDAVECTSNIDCDDGLSCTDDVCDTQLGECTSQVAPGMCAIDTQCYSTGDRNPENECEECLPSGSQHDWSHRIEGAECGNLPMDDCDEQDTCDGAGVCVDRLTAAGTVCRAASDPCDATETCMGDSPTCPPDMDQPDGSPCSNQTYCDGLEICLAGVCVDGIDPCQESEVCIETTDTCHPDCNVNGIADHQDISGETSSDCNNSGVPDDCELLVPFDFDFDGAIQLSDYPTLASCITGPSSTDTPAFPLYSDPCCALADVDGDGDVDLFDVQEFQLTFEDLQCTTLEDCENADPCTIDECLDGVCQSTDVSCNPGEICAPTSGDCVPDCNSNGIDDADDISFGSAVDCNLNDIPDLCDIENGSPDVNSNSIPDECEVADCNDNGVDDAVEIAAGSAEDCNTNGILDGCDIAAGTSVDLDVDGIPDECIQSGLVMGLIAYYPFDGNALDFSDNGNHGIEVNGVQYVDGAIGLAADFNGQSHVLMTSPFVPIDSEYSVTFWIKTSDELNYFIHSWGPAPDKEAFIVSLHLQPVVLAAYQDGSSASTSATSIVDDNWHHAAIVRRFGTTGQSDIAIYIDGEFAGGGTVEGDVGLATETVIGNHHPDHDVDDFVGSLDEVRFYDRALTGAEIETLATVQVPTTVLNLFYPLDGDFLDASGHDNHGISSNGVTFVPGALGEAAHFDGMDDLIEMSQPFDPSSGPYTISFWLNTLEEGSAYIVHSHGTAVPRAQEALILMDGNSSQGPGLYVLQSGSGDVFATEALFKDGLWHHVCVTRTDVGSGYFKLYIDGALIDEGLALREPTQATTTRIGGSVANYNPHAWYEGDIDEFRIYGRVLSEVEINALARVTMLGPNLAP